MEPQATLTISWQALTGIVGVLVLVVGMATGYLKLFVAAKISEMQMKLAELEKNLLRQIKSEFQDKELSMKVEKDFESRIARLEGKVFQGA